MATMYLTSHGSQRSYRTSLHIYARNFMLSSESAQFFVYPLHYFVSYIINLYDDDDNNSVLDQIRSFRLRCIWLHDSKRPISITAQHCTIWNQQRKLGRVEIRSLTSWRSFSPAEEFDRRDIYRRRRRRRHRWWWTDRHRLHSLPWRPTVAKVMNCLSLYLPVDPSVPEISLNVG